MSASNRTPAHQENSHSASGRGSGSSASSASGPVQLRARVLGNGFEAQEAALRPEGHGPSVQQRAAEGVAGSGGALPHADTIQRSFGGYDIRNVQAHLDSSAQGAAQDIGASAYATDNHVAFGTSPSLHTAAHETAHVVQQRAGVQLKGGVGEVGDTYERNADEVADAVVAGNSAEPILAKIAPKNGTASGVQMKAIQKEAEPSYSIEATAMPDQKPGQSYKARATEMEGQLSSDMAQGVKTAGTWEQEMALLRDNVAATYNRVEAGFRQFGLGLYEVFENQELVLAAVARRQAQTAAFVSGVVGIGLAFVGAGLGEVAKGTVTSVVARLGAGIGTQGQAFVVQGLIGALKSGVSTVGGIPLKYSPSTPPSFGGGSVRAIRDNGLAAVSMERADATSLIAWLTNHRAELEGAFPPAAFVQKNRQEWAKLQAGGSALLAGVDTRAIERNLWESWVGKHGKSVGISSGYSQAPPRMEFNVPKEVLEHLQDRLGISEATMRAWAGM